jgi:hypothetical protein
LSVNIVVRSNHSCPRLNERALVYGVLATLICRATAIRADRT